MAFSMARVSLDWLAIFLALETGLSAAVAAQAAAPTVSLSVDATAAPRKIFHARLSIPASPGTLTLYYPKWIPGEHGPTGPIQDLAGLRFMANGQLLEWRRDLLDGWTFHVEVPQGVSAVEAQLDFISPTGHEGIYTGGQSATAKMAILSWNALLLYPAGWTADELKYQARLELPEGWKAKLPTFSATEKPLATRQASGKVLNAISPSLPILLGGAADLAPSTDTLIKGEGDFERGHYGQRNFHFGVREHGMGAILNGMALSGLIPYGATFFIFSDYLRPTLRLAAMMKVHSMFVFTHDSIFLGEDGPTHQPIEQLPALRAIPNLSLIRPCDANETVTAWRVAIEHRGGPVALCLTRQALPTIDRTKYGAAEGLAKGAYVLADAQRKAPELILIASGSEVAPALEAYEKLAGEGVAARLVSMPSWDLFEKQPQSYRDEIFPPSVTARLAIEAAAPFGWERYVGTKGDVIGMERFGASAPYKVLAEKFGFTAANIVQRAHKLLGAS